MSENKILSAFSEDKDIVGLSMERLCSRVSRKNPKLDFEVALYVFPLLGDTLTPKKFFGPLACF